MGFHRRHATRRLSLSLSALLFSGCGGDNEQSATGPSQQPELNCSAQSSRLDDPRLTVAGSDESFMQVARGYLNEIGTAGCAAQRETANDSGSGNPPPGAPAAGEGNNSGGSGAPAAPAPNDLRSDTNVQEVGVDEADLVETDGRYLYVANAGARYGFGVVPIGRGTVSAPLAAVTDPSVGAPPDAMAAFVRIMSLDNDTPAAQQVARIDLPDTASNVQGIYLRDSGNDGSADQLLVIAGGTVKEGAATSFGTLVFAYNVNNPAEPRLNWTLGVGSSHATSRLKDGKLYLVENSYISVVPVPMPPIAGAEPARDTAQAKNVDTIGPADLLPLIYLDGEPKNFVKASDCLVPVATNPDLYIYPDLVTVLAIDLADPNNTRGLCTLESSGEVYVSNSAIYLARSNGDDTLVHKIRFTPDGMEYAASGTVPGYVGGTNTRFALSEKEEDLRVVTTAYNFGVTPGSPPGGNITPPSGGSTDPGGAEDGGVVSSPPAEVAVTRPANAEGPTIAPTLGRALDTTTHKLFILRENAEAKLLEQIAALPNEARPRPLGKPDEMLYGVRFVADRAYLVTYKQTDPFYVIDLSDPKDPFIAGELELPGYSDYLQSLSENLILGIGKAAINQGDFAWYQGVKVGVFDVSDPSQPKVLGETLIGKRGTESPALSDHHAVTVVSDAETGTHRIAVPVAVHEEATTKPGEPGDPSTYFNWSYNGLFLFSVADGTAGQAPSFSDAGVMIGDRVDSASGHFYFGAAHRSIIVGDAVHYASEDGVWSAKWQTPDQSVGPQ